MNDDAKAILDHWMQRLPLQSPPVMRAVVKAALGGAGVEASDNDHNTDTEHDLFFVKIE